MKLSECLRLSCCLLYLALVTGAAAADFEFEIINGEAVLVGMQNASGTVQIPSSYQGSPVVEIMSIWGSGDTGELLTVIVPDTVKRIGEFVRSNLTAIEIPSSVVAIGFLGGGQSFNDSLYEINGFRYYLSATGAYLIEYDSQAGGDLVGHVSIPSQVAGLPVVSVAGLSHQEGMTSISIPNTVKGIGMYTFGGCLGLTSISIPDSVEVIDQGAFWGCSNLATINLGNSINYMGESAFEDCTALASIELPDTVSFLPDSTFGNCSSLASIELPASLHSIGQLAFSGCSSLESITLPDTLESIGSQAFAGCSLITSLSIPDSVSYIGENAFGDVDRPSALVELSIPSRFAPVLSALGVPTDLAPDLFYGAIAEVLKGDADFVAAVAAAMLAAENNSGFATKQELPLVEQQGVDLVLADPAAYNLATSSEVAAARVDGQQDVLSDPPAYALYDESSIMELNASTPTLSMTGPENQAEIEFTIETTDDLSTWTVNERIQRTVEGQGDKFFVRIKAGAPFVDPSVLVYEHPTLGRILTNAEGYVLYGFTFNTNGQDPIYTGSSWSFVPVPVELDPDAGITASLGANTFGNVEGGPWLTVNGVAAYTSGFDAAPYEANGQGSGDVWFTMRPDGSLNRP
jgi:hypothetical protein